MVPFDNPARIDIGLDCRAINFENPTGERGGGGKAAKGRKGAPSKMLAAGETIVADARKALVSSTKVRAIPAIRARAQ